MSRQSTADNLADLVRTYGGQVSGNETTAQLLDRLETLAPQGGGMTPQAIEEDMDEIFSD